MRVKAMEREILEDGFRRVYQPVADLAAPPTVPAGQGRLARLRKGERVKPRRVQVRKKAPPRAGMSEAALILAMQASGIGRPSTYAATIETLVARDYAARNQAGELAPTERGRAVCAFLVDRFPALFAYSFTARMEARLDDIARGDATYEEVISDFWKELSTTLEGGRVNVATTHFRRSK